MRLSGTKVHKSKESDPSKRFEWRSRLAVQPTICIDDLDHSRGIERWAFEICSRKVLNLLLLNWLGAAATLAYVFSISRKKKERIIL